LRHHGGANQGCAPLRSTLAFPNDSPFDPNLVIAFVVLCLIAGFRKEPNCRFVSNSQAIRQVLVREQVRDCTSDGHGSRPGELGSR